MWENLAQDFTAEPTVLIAKVDAEAVNSKSTAEAQGVKSYPTIKYFPKGSLSPIPYEGARTEKDFVDFLNTNAGTHRTVGGGLNTKAGTVEALDAIVSRYTAGGSLISISKEANDAAAGLKDKYVGYYIKIFEKLSKSQGYVDKELTRIQNLLRKGGLAPEKLDDLVSRSNILRKFSSTNMLREEL